MTNTRHLESLIKLANPHEIHDKKKTGFESFIPNHKNYFKFTKNIFQNSVSDFLKVASRDTSINLYHQ